ncbi:MAG: hypothetical protein KDB63_08300 [Nocardioidaceae bacterium]|nr:hypothetical protein [Nocardioidaceae bacterium]
MERDPGILALPWVTVEHRGRTVLVDGVPLEGTGSVEDRTQRALRRVSRLTATPLGRSVGVTVRDHDGRVRSFLVRPDGEAVELAALVADANASLAPVIPLRAAAPVRPANRRASWARPTRVVVATVLAVLLVGGGVALASASSDRTPVADTSPVSLSSDETSPSASPSPSTAPVVRLGAALVADVQPAGPGTVRVTVGAAPGSSRVTVVLRGPSGPAVTRQLLVSTTGTRSLVVRGLVGGATTWRVSSAGVTLASGTLAVAPRAAAPTPVQPPPVLPGSSAGPGGSSGGSSGGSGGSGGQPHASPSPVDATPIDPDDG